MCGKTPRDPPKHAKRKEIKGQAILTSELPTINTQKKCKKYEIDTTTQKKKKKTEEQRQSQKKKKSERKNGEIRNSQHITKKRKKGKERRNIPLKKCSTNWKKKIAGAESEWSQK